MTSVAPWSQGFTINGVGWGHKGKQQTVTGVIFEVGVRAGRDARIPKVMVSVS